MRLRHSLLFKQFESFLQLILSAMWLWKIIPRVILWVSDPLKGAWDSIFISVKSRPFCLCSGWDFCKLGGRLMVLRMLRLNTGLIAPPIWLLTRRNLFPWYNSFIPLCCFSSSCVQCSAVYHYIVFLLVVISVQLYLSFLNIISLVTDKKNCNVLDRHTLCTSFSTRTTLVLTLEYKTRIVVSHWHMDFHRYSLISFSIHKKIYSYFQTGMM